MRKNRFRNTLLVTMLVAIVLLASACRMFGGGNNRENTVVIGGKNFTEQDILVWIMAELVDAKTDLNVTTRPFLGGTNVVAQALERGDLDIYAEYTGTGLLNILNMEVMTDPQEVYATVKRIYQEDKNLVWLEPLGFNNTYAMAMRAQQAEELGIETISDLVQYAPNMVLGSTHEFLERPDGYQGMQGVYGLQFRETRGMDPGLTYAAVRDGASDVNDAFSTDGRIVAFNLKVLEDDKQFFPPYYAAPVIRQDTLNKFPQLAEVLNQLGGRLNDQKMSELNARVDLNGENPRTVAQDWLRAEGLIQ